MKVTLFAIFLIALSVGLFFFSGTLFLFSSGLLVGLLLGTYNGFVLNDWYETTWHYKWRKRRREAKAAKLSNHNVVA